MNCLVYYFYDEINEQSVWAIIILRKCLTSCPEVEGQLLPLPALLLSPMYITWLILHICYINIALIFFITFAQMTLSKCSIWHKVLELWHCFKASGFVAQHGILRTLASAGFFFFFLKQFHWRFHLYYPWSSMA